MEKKKIEKIIAILKAKKEMHEKEHSKIDKFENPIEWGFGKELCMVCSIEKLIKKYQMILNGLSREKIKKENTKKYEEKRRRLEDSKFVDNWFRGYNC